MKKIFLSIFVLSFVVTPAVSNAGFFDFFRIDFGRQSAQVRAATSSYKEGDKNGTIKDVQEALKDAGIYTGSTNGNFGPKTEDAVEDWQRANGLRVTGILDTETINSILRGGDDVGCLMSIPHVIVESPNGGEEYQAGDQMTVTWETCNITSANVYVTIETSSTGQSISTILSTNPSGTPNDGEETFTVPSGFTPGGYYVSVFTPAPNYNVDFSNETFFIGGGDANPNAHYGDTACNMRVLTPSEGVTIDPENVPEFTTLIEVDYDDQGSCGWGVFEGVAGGVELIDMDTGEVLAGQLSDAFSQISSSDPYNYYTGQAYFLAALQFVEPLPGTISDNVFLHFIEDNTNGNPNPDELFMEIEIPTQQECGIMPELISTETNLDELSPGPDLGQFEVRFKVTAIECDVRISTASEVNGADQAGQGVEFHINTANPDSDYNYMADTVTCVSGCENPRPGGFEIEEGEQATFDLIVVIQAQEPGGLYRMILDSINWDTSSSYTQFYTSGLGSTSNYKTDYLNLQPN